MKLIRRAAGVLFLVIAGFFSVAVVKALIRLPITLDRLEETVWLADGQYDPANEDKLVTLVLDPNSLGNARDTDLDLTFQSPVVKRYVEEFAACRTGLTGNGVEWCWQPVTGVDSRSLRYKSFAGDRQDGSGEALSLDQVYDPMLPAGKNVDFGDLTPESQKRAEELFDTCLSGGYLWFTDAPAVCFGDDLTLDGRLGGFSEYEGCVRIRYVRSFDEAKPVAVTGVQQGRTLMKDDSLDLRPVAEGVTDYDGLRRDTIFGVVGGSLLVQLGILFLLYFGLKWLGILPVGAMELINALTRHADENGKTEP